MNKTLQEYIIYHDWWKRVNRIKNLQTELSNSNFRSATVA